MKLIEFEEQTVVFAKDQPEYNPLPAYKYKDDDEGEIVFCWEMNVKLGWRERFKILFSGVFSRHLWHHVLTFNQSLQPQRLTLEKPEMPKHEE